MMVGREVLLRVDKTPAQPGEPLLAVEDLDVLDDRGLEAVAASSFERARAARSSASPASTRTARRELIDAIAGLRHAGRGRDRAGRRRHHARERRATCSTPASGHIPRTATAAASCSPFSLAENLALHDYRHAAELAARLARAAARCSSAPSGCCTEFDVRGGAPTTPAGALSGGNQQKVVLAREIDGNPKVLIAAQPTRGLDVGAIEFVHRRLVEQRDAGRAVFLVSLELEEILSLSDRILVIYEGRIVGEFPPTATEEELGFAMTGGGGEEAA